jgi:hypothetical protein
MICIGKMESDSILYDIIEDPLYTDLYIDI